MLYDCLCLQGGDCGIHPRLLALVESIDAQFVQAKHNIQTLRAEKLRLEDELDRVRLVTKSFGFQLNQALLLIAVM